MNNNKSHLIADFFTKYPLHVYNKGKVILYSDTPRESVFYIEKGYARAYTISGNGSQKIYLFYKPGEFFPIISTFSGISRNLFYEAMEEVAVRKIPKKEFLPFAKGSQEVLLHVLDRILNNHNTYVKRVDELEYTNAYSRLIAGLISLGERFGEDYKTGTLIKIPVTHSDIANSIAMTRETASREIERLEKKNLVEKKGRLIVLTNVPKLKQELEKAAERNCL